MKGVIPTPDIAKNFQPTPDIKAKKMPDTDTQNSPRHLTLTFQKMENFKLSESPSDQNEINTFVLI